MVTLYEYCKENNKEYLLDEWDYELNAGFDVKTILSGSNKKMWWHCKKCNGKWQATICDRTRTNGTGCPFCAGQKVLKGYNDLATKYPEAVKQWHPTKNQNLKPSEVMSKSGKKVWWICDKGHEFEQKIIARVKHLSSCPICSGQKVLKNSNDLASKYPEVAKEWNYKKNSNITPEDITWGSNKKFWWKCSKCNHEWAARVSDRTRGHNGCPACANKVLVVGFNDLASQFPEIAKEWHPTKNGNLKPDNVKAVEPKKVWWICSKGHEFEQSINSRLKHLYSCPICSGQKLLRGFNDLATTHPEIAKEWHPTKNGNLKPTDVIGGSDRKIWWKCPTGHEYMAKVSSRKSGTNCPICNLRNATSFPEQAIFYYIKQVCTDAVNKYGEIFNTTMELDIYIPSLKLGIEYDGTIWHNKEEHYKREQKKYDLCKEEGIYLIRIKEHSNLKWENIADEIYYLPKVKRYNLNDLEKIIANLIEKINPIKKISIDLNRDKYQILKYIHRIKNSLAEKKPEVAKKWNYEKNGYLKPNMFSVSSNEIVWWKCPDCGNEWETSINQMTRKNACGCAICANIQRGKKYTKAAVQKVGSLAETMPKLAKEWHPTKNGDLTPWDITSGRAKAVWWLCSKCSHEWQASPNLRKNGIGCPCCSGRVPKIGVNDLETTHPQIAKEWNYAKNGELKPNMFKRGSDKKVWWICSECGNEYEARIAQRTSKRKSTSCPVCGQKNRIKANSCKVNMIDINTNEIIKTFGSFKEASEEMHIHYNNISKTCKGLREQAGGYKWSYAE